MAVRRFWTAYRILLCNGWKPSPDQTIEAVCLVYTGHPWNGPKLNHVDLMDQDPNF